MKLLMTIYIKKTKLPFQISLFIPAPYLLNFQTTELKKVFKEVFNQQLAHKTKVYS